MWFKLWLLLSFPFVISQQATGNLKAITNIKCLGVQLPQYTAKRQLYVCRPLSSLLLHFLYQPGACVHISLTKSVQL